MMKIFGICLALLTHKIGFAADQQILPSYESIFGNDAELMLADHCEHPQLVETDLTSEIIKLCKQCGAEEAEEWRERLTITKTFIINYWREQHSEPVKEGKR